jgi:cell division protein FtsL
MSLDSAACPTPLSIAPRQLAEIFAMFNNPEGDEEDAPTPSTKPTSYVAVPNQAYTTTTIMPKGPENTDSDAATEVTSNTFTPSTVVCHPKIESLQRECETLKQIIGTDSAKMLQLQGEIKRLMERLDQAATEKKQLQREIRGLQLEREASLRQQQIQEETIERLTVELERVPSDRTCAGASFDLEELKLANELLASQVIEAERELARTNSDRDSDKENSPPPVTPNMKSDWGVSTCYTSGPSASRDPLVDITPQKLALQLEQLESRLKHLEDDALSRSTKSITTECSEVGIQCDMETKTETVQNVVPMPLEGDGGTVVGIEVNIDGTLSIVTTEQIRNVKPPQPQPPQKEVTQPRKCSGEFFCDCLPRPNEQGPQEV